MRKKKMCLTALLASAALFLSACGQDSGTVTADATVSESAETTQSESAEEKPADTESVTESENITEAESDTETEIDTETESETETETETEAPASDIDPEQIVNEIMTAASMTSMAEIESDRIGGYIDFDMDKVEAFSMYICGSGAFADEAAVFRLKDEADADELIEALEARSESKDRDFRDYIPEECPKIENAVLKSNGCYVIYVVSSDNDGAEKIFDSKF